MGNPKQSHAVCGAKKRDGSPCQSKQMPNGRCRMHGGTNTGAPPGNQNARAHGLFSKSLGEVGQEVYTQAKEAEPTEIARDAANFIVAQVAQAHYWDDTMDGALAVLADTIDQMVEDERLSFKAGEVIKRRLKQPTIDQLGKAMAPLKGLLEIKRADEGGDVQPGVVLAPVASEDWRKLIGG